jgi:hypothetical protein
MMAAPLYRTSRALQGWRMAGAVIFPRAYLQECRFFLCESPSLREHHLGLGAHTLSADATIPESAS